MKKAFLSLAGLAMVSAMFIGIANAQLTIDNVFQGEVPTIEDFQMILNNPDAVWGYSSIETPTVNLLGENQMAITSPAVFDSELEPASIYRLYASPYRVAKLKDGSTDVDVAQVIEKEFKQNEGVDVEFLISKEEGFNPDQVYYGFITPIDYYDEIGGVSEEFCFVLKDNNFQMGTDKCDELEKGANPEVNPEDITPEKNEEHGAAGCIGMDLAGVTHTVDSKNVVTLKWTTVGDPNSNVEIAIFNPNEESYEKLADVKMSAEKYSYKIKWDGEQIFMLKNDCKELVYKADVTSKTPVTPEEGEIVPPVTGPADNIFAVIIAAIVLYGVYVVFFRKADQ